MKRVFIFIHLKILIFIVIHRYNIYIIYIICMYYIYIYVILCIQIYVNCGDSPLGQLSFDLSSGGVLPPWACPGLVRGGLWSLRSSGYCEVDPGRMASICLRIDIYIYIFISPCWF